MPVWPVVTAYIQATADLYLACSSMKSTGNSCHRFSAISDSLPSSGPSQFCFVSVSHAKRNRAARCLLLHMYLLSFYIKCSFSIITVLNLIFFVLLRGGGDFSGHDYGRSSLTEMGPGSGRHSTSCFYHQFQSPGRNMCIMSALETSSDIDLDRSYKHGP